MDFRTRIDIEKPPFSVQQQDSTLLLGSCFAQHIGNKLADSKFSVDINPFGVIYNPLSMAQSVERLMSNRAFSADDIVSQGDMFHSFWLHSDFSSPLKAHLLQHANERFERASAQLPQVQYLLLTFGTAYYFTTPDGLIVNNCHKFAPAYFSRKLASADEIIRVWCQIIPRLLQINPHIKLIFTVSPIRHLKDGAHGNQLSKASLLLAIEGIRQRFPKVCSYFPAYELVLDDLRDYRFYADDMVHPSPMAINYMWEHFAQTYFAPHTRQCIAEWDKIHKRILHRPMHLQSEAYSQFVAATIERIRAFSARYPHIPVQQEINQLNHILSTLS